MMQYSQLIQFENLEPVIQLRHADVSDKVKRLVATYVISEEMAGKLINVVFSQLRFDQVSNKKGLFIVGNYGTGKSHLMAVISSLAEKTDLVKYLNHPEVAKIAKQTIAGKFHVLRVEIGSTQMSLREILTAKLEESLALLGVNYHFPPVDKIINNKTAFEAMMAAFQARYPKKGLLVVVDEMLEFLRARKDRELLLDLSFLREIGEVCQDLRLRFIAGVQETIFENPRFKFAANELRRVKDRFEQVLITRKDIKFVVSARLLKKDVAQQSQIRDYLTRFAKFYGALNERMEEFVALFPVHPDYIDVFERIIAVEQREVLKTLERAMQALLDQAVPDNYPGLLAYDSYWNILRENFSFRATDDIREVIDCSQVLEDRINQAFTRPNYQAMAVRIIHALSVHRLTTHDFYAPMGVTARELRDSLCLYQAGIEDLGNPADDLLSQVELVLREILKTVNRQFISTNSNNGQYYLDLKKTEDFDAIIDSRAEILENNDLDRYYYVALRQVMEVMDEPYVGNFLIWQHELEWQSHKVTRLGYLFFGTPNERATAVPERDFYLYFLQPYDPPKYQKSATTADEVFFHLQGKDEEFQQILRHYTAASMLGLNSSGHPKSVYESKAKLFLAQLVAWLQAHLRTAFEVTYQNRTLPLLDWTKGQNVRDLAKLDKEERINFREIIELVASLCLENNFAETAPEYPRFAILITRQNLAQAAQEALRGMVVQKRSKQATKILEALKLLNGEQLEPLNPQSQYALYILDLLQNKPSGQVLNQTELLPEEYFEPTKYRLEPEFVMVILAALVQAGEVVLAMSGQKWNTSNFKGLVDTPIEDLLGFKHIERPKDFNVPALKALFALFGLSNDLAIQLTQNQESAVQVLHQEVQKNLVALVKAQDELSKGVTFWGKAVVSEPDMRAYRTQFTQTKQFLESLQVYSTPAQFKNFRYSLKEVTAQQNGLEILQEVNQLQTILRELNQATAYLMAAEAVLPPEHGWIQEMKQVRDNLLPRVTDPKQRASNGFSYQTQQQLGTLQKTYRQLYLTAHQQARLDSDGDEEKQALLQDERLMQLKKWAHIDIMPQQQLDDLEARIHQLATCFKLGEYDLVSQAFCPHCGFKPSSQASIPVQETLAELGDTLAQLQQEWTQSLLTELEQVAESEQWGLLQAQNQTLLESVLTDKQLPAEMTPELLEAVQEALSGLEKVSLNLKELQQAILAGGFPCQLAELQRRINQYMQTATKGKQTQKIRIVLD